MGETTFRLAPPRQVHVRGIGIGVLAIRPDPALRMAVVGVFDPDLQEPRAHRVEPGSEVVAGDVRVRVVDVVPGPERHVDLVVSWPDEPGAPS